MNRKPEGVSWRSWVERLIAEAQAAGELDPGEAAGRPLDLDGPHDELWWIRRKIAEERLDVLPPQVAVRRELEEARRRAAAAPDRRTARRILEDINERIRTINRTTISGPPTTVAPVDVDAELTRLRPGEPPPGGGDAQEATASREGSSAGRRRRWARRRWRAAR